MIRHHRLLPMLDTLTPSSARAVIGQQRSERQLCSGGETEDLREHEETAPHMPEETQRGRAVARHRSGCTEALDELRVARHRETVPAMFSVIVGLIHQRMHAFGLGTLHLL